MKKIIDHPDGSKLIIIEDEETGSKKKFFEYADGSKYEILFDLPTKPYVTFEYRKNGRRKKFKGVLGAVAKYTYEDCVDSACFIVFDDRDVGIFNTILFDDILNEVKFSSQQISSLTNFLNSNFINEVIQSKWGEYPIGPNQITIWADKSLDFSYPYENGLRELRLNEIYYDNDKNSFYWRCFCYMKKAKRTFKETSLGNSLFYEQKEYSMSSFYTDVLKLNRYDVIQATQK